MNVTLNNANETWTITNVDAETVSYHCPGVFGGYKATGSITEAMKVLRRRDAVARAENACGRNLSAVTKARIAASVD